MTWRVYTMPRPASAFNWMPTLARIRELVEADGGQFALQLVDAEYEAATEAARAFGWDGQFMEGPHVFTLPNADSMQFGLVWTQPDDRLTTFIVSPRRLPWLE
jgi:hypothetical protein